MTDNHKKWLTVTEYAEETGKSVRHVQQLCKAGRIDGAKKIISGQYLPWRIPSGAKILPLGPNRTQEALDLLYGNPGMLPAEAARLIGINPSVISRARRKKCQTIK